MKLCEVRLRSLSKPQNQGNVPGYIVELATILQKRRCHIRRNIFEILLSHRAFRLPNRINCVLILTLQQGFTPRRNEIIRPGSLMCFRIWRAPELFNPKSSCGMWQPIFVTQQKHCVTSEMEEEVSHFTGKLNDNDDDATTAMMMMMMIMMKTAMIKEHYFRLS